MLVDWNMPVMSGLSFVEAIRSDERFKKLPIIMVTMRGTREDVLKAIEAKVNCYVVKPFTPEVLREKIEYVLWSA